MSIDLEKHEGETDEAYLARLKAMPIEGMPLNERQARNFRIATTKMAILKAQRTDPMYTIKKTETIPVRSTVPLRRSRSLVWSNNSDSYGMKPPSKSGSRSSSSFWGRSERRRPEVITQARFIEALAWELQTQGVTFDRAELEGMRQSTWPDIEAEPDFGHWFRVILRWMIQPPGPRKGK